MPLHAQIYIYMYAQATAYIQTYLDSIAHKLRHIYTQTKSPFEQKMNHINHSFLKKNTNFSLSDEYVKNETQGHRHYHVIYIYI